MSGIFYISDSSERIQLIMLKRKSTTAPQTFIMDNIRYIVAGANTDSTGTPTGFNYKAVSALDSLVFFAYYVMIRGFAWGAGLSLAVVFLSSCLMR